MAYKTADMIEQSLKVIKDNNLIFIDEIFAYVPFSSATFYNHKLEKLESLKKELGKNRIKTKQKLRKKWSESNAPALQIALYRLLATDKEYDRLIMQKFDHTTAGSPLGFQIDIINADKSKTK